MFSVCIQLRNFNPTLQIKPSSPFSSYPPPASPSSIFPHSEHLHLVQEGKKTKNKSQNVFPLLVLGCIPRRRCLQREKSSSFSFAGLFFFASRLHQQMLPSLNFHPPLSRQRSQLAGNRWGLLPELWWYQPMALSFKPSWMTANQVLPRSLGGSFPRSKWHLGGLALVVLIDEPGRLCSTQPSVFKLLSPASVTELLGLESERERERFEGTKRGFICTPLLISVCSWAFG